MHSPWVQTTTLKGGRRNQPVKLPDYLFLHRKLATCPNLQAHRPPLAMWAVRCGSGPNRTNCQRSRTRHQAGGPACRRPQRWAKGRLHLRWANNTLICTTRSIWKRGAPREPPLQDNHVTIAHRSPQKLAEDLVLHRRDLPSITGGPFLFTIIGCTEVCVLEPIVDGHHHQRPFCSARHQCLSHSLVVASRRAVPDVAGLQHTHSWLISPICGQQSRCRWGQNWLGKMVKLIRHCPIVPWM